MKKISLFVLCSCCYFCFAQDITKPKNKIQHNLFLELGGNSVYLYNITYDCSFQLEEKHKITAGLGFQYMPFKVFIFFYPHTFGLSPQFNYLYGKKHHLEIGTGITAPFFLYYHYYTQEWRTNSGIIIPLRIGYRYQRSDGGVFWKIAFVPLFGKGMYFPVGKTGKIPFFPSGGVSIGYTF
ncbi:MAG: hypothetical protein LBR45_02075, partial [Bacteroidales bacterium]|nr:hypothetical protein [Bacteroidales bacterium]